MKNVNRGKACPSKIQTNLFGFAMREMRGQRPARGAAFDRSPLRERLNAREQGTLPHWGQGYKGYAVRIHGGARRGARDYGTGTRVHRWLWRWVVRAESTDRSTLARVEVGRARTAPPFRAPRNNTPSARTRRARHWPSSTPDLPQETLADYRPVALLPSLPNSFQNRQNLQGISLSIGGCPHICSH